MKMLYVTVGSQEEARTISRVLLEERLAACTNLLPGMQSMYWWEDKIQEDQEIVLIAKTQDHLVEDAMQAIKARHSYDCPCVVVLPIEAGLPAYLDWLATQTKGQRSID